MRAIITKPLYRALKSAAERKAAFQQFIDSEAKREREEREERETKQRSDFFLMLENTKQVKPYTRFRTVIKLCQHLPAFQKTEKREAYFDEFIQGLQRREKERLRDVRKDSTERFGQLLRSLPEISYKTSWREAQSLYKSQENDFEGMDMLDFLAVFEEYNRELWEQPQIELNQKISQRRRRERKAREGFKVSLVALCVKKGKKKIDRCRYNFIIITSLFSLSFTIKLSFIMQNDIIK
jgi:pre-mRNA-processing factor 40